VNWLEYRCCKCGHEEMVRVDQSGFGKKLLCEDCGSISEWTRVTAWEWEVSGYFVIWDWEEL